MKNWLLISLGLMALGITLFMIGYFMQKSDNQLSQAIKNQPRTIDYDDAAKQACLKNGGVVIESAWDNRITNCIYKTKQ